ncbi:hypothetical protein [Streptomyces pseudovenezuelae]|uniref:Integral membrane protein n=1 Tax=Streptomyces pseudovenezuelae TaxID=67350 RepID=A0ABT6LUS6_9ACTN|nr:hypothetical protein [Streptomyces pseudovenezuelae]MDH6220057.1 hypothetical protein [Streptomyces pseudovenezuelae]
MSGLGELDRPGTPTNPGAWDERSEEWGREETEPGDGPADVGSAATSSALSDTSISATSASVAPTPAASTTPTPTPTPAPTVPEPPTPRRRATAADPVKALMHRHRDLCERAVDPLEIAAGLEAHGVTDRTATRFRHRDVFSLAEEMYARASHGEETQPSPETPSTSGGRVGWALLALLPGTLCAATVIGLPFTHGRLRLTVALAGALAVALGLRSALARGPLGVTDRTPSGPAPHTPGTGLWTCWLIAYALLGDGLLSVAVGGGPDGLPTGAADGPWPVATAPVLALTLACAPAAWSAHLLTVRARRRLTASRGLADFAASVRPLLLGTFTLFVCALAALLALCATALDQPAAYAQALTLGALLLLARLLTTHGFTHAPALVLAATATAEAAALVTVFAARLPGCGFLATPVEALLDATGPGSVPALACGAAALTLLVHATRTLTRASAHAPADRPC